MCAGFNQVVVLYVAARPYTLITRFKCAAQQLCTSLYWVYDERKMGISFKTISDCSLVQVKGPQQVLSTNNMKQVLVQQKESKTNPDIWTSHNLKLKHNSERKRSFTMSSAVRNAHRKNQNMHPL